MQRPDLEDRYEIKIAWSDADEAFVALIMELPYAGGHGDTHEETLASAKGAIRAYVQVAQEFGKLILKPKASLVS